MTKHTPDAKRRDTLPLPGKVGRIIQSLARSSLGNAKSDPQEPTSPILEVSEEAVTQFVKAWRVRTSYLPSELLLDPAWAMLLELLQAEIQGRRVSFGRLCKVSALSASSAARWLNALESRELVLRRAEAENDENEFVELSPRGSSILRRYFHDVGQSSRSFEDQY